jgi:hypothetical protein
MENGVDFIYEYSDLNLFCTRVQILTGEYKDLILEFGASGLAQWVENGEPKNKFDFTYALLEVPNQLRCSGRLSSPEFEQYLMSLLVNIIADRNNDPDWKVKLDEAASKFGVQNSKIKISEQHYPNKLMVFAKEQPKTTGFRGF